MLRQFGLEDAKILGVVLNGLSESVLRMISAHRSSKRQSFTLAF